MEKPSSAVFRVSPSWPAWGGRVLQKRTTAEGGTGGSRHSLRRKRGKRLGGGKGRTSTVLQNRGHQSKKEGEIKRFLNGTAEGKKKTGRGPARVRPWNHQKHSNQNSVAKRIPWLSKSKNQANTSQPGGSKRLEENPITGKRWLVGDKNHSSFHVGQSCSPTRVQGKTGREKRPRRAPIEGGLANTAWDTGDDKEGQSTTVAGTKGGGHRRSKGEERKTTQHEDGIKRIHGEGAVDGGSQTSLAKHKKDGLTGGSKKVVAENNLTQKKGPTRQERRE